MHSCRKFRNSSEKICSILEPGSSVIHKQQCLFAVIVKVLGEPGLVERKLMSYFRSGIGTFCGFILAAVGIGERSSVLALIGLFSFADGLFFIIRR